LRLLIVSFMVKYRTKLEEREARWKSWRDGTQEEQYVNSILSGKTGAVAAKEAGYTVRAQRTPRKLIETPELKARMQQSLMRKRVTLDVIAERVSSALDAKVVADGVQTDVVDHKTRLKATEVASRLWGLDESQKQATVAVQINFPAGLAELFASDANEVTDQ
jgi:hypothetical protein